MLYFILITILLIIALPVICVIGLIFFYRKKLKFSENFSEIYDKVYSMMQDGNFDLSSIYDFQKKGSQLNTGESRMSKSQAREILGLSQEATREDAKKAYHSLIQKIHPDKGGSTYLAQQLNKAKDTLLKG